MRRPLSVTLAAAVLALGACHQVHGPPVGIAKLSELPTPLPKPYDEAATPDEMKARLDAAFARAASGHKRVIVDFGGNWCVWCRLLAGVMAQPSVRPYIDANFEVVPVDISSAEGKFDRNAEVLARFNVTRIGGVPWLVVADANGQVLASTDAVTDDSHHTPQQMVDWLAQWAQRPPA